MNSQELESLFIESNELNSHNQISQFKKAVILSKEKHNPEMEHITYDTPVYFDIAEVYRYIKNKNAEVINKKDGTPRLPIELDGSLVEDADNEYLAREITFAPTSTSKDAKASPGPYNGEFERFVTRLETKLSDKRLRFITKPEKEDGTSYTTQDFADILKQFLGYQTLAQRINNTGIHAGIRSADIFDCSRGNTEGLSGAGRQSARSVRTTGDGKMNMRFVHKRFTYIAQRNMIECNPK